MTENSLLPMSAMCTGRDFDGLVSEMLAPAIGDSKKLFEKFICLLRARLNVVKAGTGLQCQTV